MTVERKTPKVSYKRATRGREGHWVWRLHLVDGVRPWRHGPPAPRSPNAEHRAKEKAEEEQREAIEKGLVGSDFGLGPKQPRKPASAPAAGAMNDWFRDWTKSRRARGLTAVRENESHYRNHIELAMGGKHVRDWSSDDMRRLAATLDRKVQARELTWKSAWNVWATATRMGRDACSSKLDALRCRADNPARDVEGPDRGASKSKQFLFPSEFLAFASCDDVPLAWRRIAALAIYLAPRAGELRVLRWEDIDLAHGTIHIHRAADRTAKKDGPTKATKTGHARRFAIEPNLLPLLEAMHAEAGGEGLVVRLPSERALARGLRRWLWNAEVRRAELHESTPSSRTIVFHDLRATGATWMAIDGVEAMKIMQRCGHENIETTMGYVRTAEALRDGFGDVFPPLPDALLGSAVAVSGSVSLRNAILSVRNVSGVDGTRKHGETRDRRGSRDSTAAKGSHPLPPKRATSLDRDPRQDPRDSVESVDIGELRPPPHVASIRESILSLTPAERSALARALATEETKATG